MKISALLTAASVAILAATTAQAQNQASNLLIQFDDTDVNGNVIGNTYENGVLIQSLNFCCETIDSNYRLLNGATLTATFTNQYNFYELGTGTLSDTSEISGVAGDRVIHFKFQSDGGSSPLTAYANGSNLVETGNWQDIVSPGTVSNGDFYAIQMRSDIDAIPEPTTWALMLAGLGGMGVALRSRRQVNTAA